MSFFHKIKRDGITILHGIHDSLFQLDNMATRTHLVHLSCTWLSHSLLVVHARLTHPCTHRSRYHTVHIDLTLYTSLKSGHTSHSESTDETTDDFPHVFPKRSRLVKTIYVWWWVTTKNATKGERGYEDFTPSVSTPKYGYHARATSVRFVFSSVSILIPVLLQFWLHTAATYIHFEILGTISWKMVTSYIL